MGVRSRWNVLAPLGLLAGFAVILVLLLVAKSPTPAAAQTNGLILEKKLLKNSNIVQVGETLTFAITITNNWNTTVITLPMIDMYDQTVLRFVAANPAQNTHIAATGVISWNNVLASTGPLAPGQSVVIITRFIAEHPSPRVVNRAETHDAYDSQGNLVGNGSSNVDNEAVGGQTPLTKTLDLTVPPIAGQQITFNLTIRNDGMANIVALPINDRFDPAALQFIYAVPAPDRVEAGLLVWTNALRAPLVTVLPPQQTVLMTVVFTALTDISQTINQAEVVGARDTYGNDLAPAADEVPIQILPGPTATPTPRPTRIPQPVEPTEAPAALPTFTPTGTPAEGTPAATEQPAAEATPEASPTAVAGGGIPIGLPDTGTNATGRLWLFGLAVILVGIAALLLMVKGRKI
ncbi:MAG: hypothetical protein H0T53_00645 [Herpetosiphonaceae bacterium]|nr:hypothetical protein [Herpetosiphonaceae bacterium]